MKIDVHTHTKKCKSGDAISRNIDAGTFAKVIKETDVGILAITNHNHFDYNQYKEFCTEVTDQCYIWPGIEFDVVREQRKGHVLVIANPNNVVVFNEKIEEIIAGKSPDNYTITIEEMVKEFDDLDVIYIPHYLVKKPALNDEDIELLCDLVKNRNRVIKEATNSISAGIFISHGHKSIYGTDIHDWKNYVNEAKVLPDLRLPVEGFEHFCLLLDKDEATINTVLDYKKAEKMELYPFNEHEKINLSLFNDINILFGSKGTGKSDILKAIEKHFSDRGTEIKVYQSSEEKLDIVFDLKGNKQVFNLSDYGISNCENEIRRIKEAHEVNVASIMSYKQFYSSEMTNKKAKSILVKDIDLLDNLEKKRELDNIKAIVKRFNDFNEYVISEEGVESAIGSSLYNELNDVLIKVIREMTGTMGIISNEVYSVKLLNDLIKIIKEEVGRKTGQPTKPTTTGFREYALNRVDIEKNIKNIEDNLKIDIENKKEEVGDLGVKGKLECITEYVFHDGAISDSKFNPIKKVKKTPQKNFINELNTIKEYIFSETLFEEISIFKENAEDIKKLDDLLLFKRYFAIDDVEYTPSNGEASMLLLHNELNSEKEIYLLDEPEKSLGNDYINEVIVPILKEKAKMGKKVVIATHDANIAVRTLPYNSIYRKHNVDNYSTFIGNPFINNLVCIESGETLDWKEISMKTLEGGKDAFGERGKIYGNYES